MAIRGHSPAFLAGRDPVESRTFGRVTVLRYAMAQPRETFDLVEALPRADVTWGSDALGWGACRMQTEVVRGGGLASGTMLPASRFVCDRARPWLGAGATFQQDVGLGVRRCVAQSAFAGHRVRTRFLDVPMRGVLEGRIGLAHGDERLRGADVWLHVRAGRRVVARVRHRDGDGARPFSVELGRLAATSGPMADLSIETSLAHAVGSQTAAALPPPAFRIACWSASVRSRRGAIPWVMR